MKKSPFNTVNLFVSSINPMRFMLCNCCLKLGLMCLLLIVLRPGIETCKADDFTTSPMVETEKRALYTALESLVGEWNGSNLYPDPCGATPIEGTVCDQFGDYWYITVLNVGAVYDNYLKCSPTASIHPAIFSFKYLKSLSFYMCFQSSPQVIPQEWGTLGVSLQSLSFRNNSALVGELPPGLGELANLELLIVTENNIKGNLPPELGSLWKLRKLVLSHNQLCGSIPGAFGYLRNLLILDLSFNAVDGDLPSQLGKLESVAKMDLSNNAIGGSIPWEFGRLRNLTLLDLRNNELRGSLPSSLMEISGLEELYLGNNSGMGGNISTLRWSNLRNLVSLDLSTSGYEGTIPESLGKLMRLRYIALNDNKLSGRVPSELAELPYVNAVYLNGNNLSGRVEFPQRFYQRMGKRLALWNNSPMLCAVAENHVPVGINPCADLVKENNHVAAASLNTAVASAVITRTCDRFVVAVIVVGLTVNFNFLL